jgi:hypothetical protein
MFVDNSSPAVNADYWDNSAFIRECINLFRPRIQSVLVGDDQQGRELLISDIPTLKCCIFSVFIRSVPASMPRRAASFPAIVESAVLIVKSPQS